MPLGLRESMATGFNILTQFNTMSFVNLFSWFLEKFDIKQ